MSSRISAGGAAGAHAAANSDASGNTSSSSSGAPLSTRDQILQRYAAGGSAHAAAASGQRTANKQTMELFESGDTQDNGDVVPAVRSDRSLLLSSGSSGGALSLGKKLHGGAAGAAVEDVDSTTRVRPALAFQHFAGALYTGEGVRQNGTFEAGPSALLVAGGGSQAPPSSVGAGAAADAQAVRLKFENPFVKLQRLQEEINEFDAQLREAAAQQPSSGAPDAAQDLWATLSTSVHQLQGQLDATLGQPAVKQMLAQGGGEAMAAAAGAGGLLPGFDSLFESYVAELTSNPSFQPFPASSSSSASAQSDAAAPAAATSAELAVLPKLDERLHTLEKLLGMSAGAKQPALPLLAFNPPAAAAGGASAAPTTSILPAPDLISALSSLHAQLVQLNPQRLEFVSRSCKQILIEQESIALNAKQSKDEATAAAAAPATAASGAKPASSPANDDKKGETAESAVARPYAAQVAHLYSLTSRWDTLALTLPTLIARLSSLHALHASSATIAGRVADLERQSAAIDSALAAQRDGVKAVAQSAADNLAAIQANFKAMDNKIQQLTKKMEQLNK